MNSVECGGGGGGFGERGEGGKFRFDLGTEKKKGRKKEERVWRLRASNKWNERVCGFL